jgi:hypothetical protein
MRGGPLTIQLGNGQGHRVVSAEIDISVSGKQEDSRSTQLSCDVLQQQERWRVGGVQVVEHEHEWLGVTHVVKEIGNGVEEAKAVCFAFDRRWELPIRLDRDKVGHELRDESVVLPKLRAKRVAVEVTNTRS